jgi:hypothetical protein
MEIFKKTGKRSKYRKRGKKDQKKDTSGREQRRSNNTSYWNH